MTMLGEQGHDYLHPALLRRWAYILPMSPIPIMPMEAFSFVSPMLDDQSTAGRETCLSVRNELAHRYDLSVSISKSDCNILSRTPLIFRSDHSDWEKKEELQMG